MTQILDRSKYLPINAKKYRIMATNIKTEIQTKLVVKKQTHLLLAECLSNILTDTYTFYLKTHKFHWYATGETYEVIRNDGIFVQTRNLKTGNLRTFTSIEIGYLKS